MSGTMKILFIDRDGTLINEPNGEQVDSFDKFALLPDVIPALLQLRDAGYTFVMVTNQDGLGTASFPEDTFWPVQNLLLQILSSQGINFADVLICPHFPADHCACRKPNIQMVRPWLTNPQINLTHSVVIGDRDTDVQLATNMGIRGIKIGAAPHAGWREIARDLCDTPRVGRATRTTKETAITIDLDLDGGPSQIRTGLGFFDHMLDQLATHGGFSLQLQATGDLHIDPHHTIEDTALVLGSALRAALGDKRGIGRYGFTLPMDEAQARVALDLGGRPFFVFNGIFPREQVGEFPTDLVAHFFKSLTDTLGATLHIDVAGENTHHMVEVIFKAVARALRMACARSGAAQLPSTKGAL